MLPQRVFVLGGAASGKSEWAENYILNSGLRAFYVATGRIFDAEVHKRVKIHQARRDESWTTIEAPIDLAPALDPLGPHDIALIDCATMWLSNHLLDGSSLNEAQTALIATLRRCKAPWVVVSNEVGNGIVPDNALAREFREAQGRLNIALAAEAFVAVHVIAGLPQILKGDLQ
jgi:adenosylcobinamide kinase/adenosylcobinamide-phosphate guanylyltransferase